MYKGSSRSLRTKIDSHDASSWARRSSLIGWFVCRAVDGTQPGRWKPCLDHDVASNEHNPGQPAIVVVGPLHHQSGGRLVVTVINPAVPYPAGRSPLAIPPASRVAFLTLGR